MKIIILAAGEGKRLSPYTDNKPKCLVEFKDKPIISYILDAVKKNGIRDIIIVDGYKKEVLEKYLGTEKINFYFNKNFNGTNMVSSLFCAEAELNNDVIISYSDIIYKSSVLKKLIESNADISVVVDKKWQELWRVRMENPLDDAETMKIDQNNNIIELGKKTKSYNEIQGQYIGLIKISKNIIHRIIHFYHSLDKSSYYDGKDFNNMYMTSFIQLIIDNLSPVKALPINGGWLEIDSVTDLQKYLTSKSKMFNF